MEEKRDEKRGGQWKEGDVEEYREGGMDGKDGGMEGQTEKGRVGREEWMQEQDPPFPLYGFGPCFIFLSLGTKRLLTC